MEFGYGCRIDQLSKWEELPKCPVTFMQWAVFVMQVVLVMQVVHHFQHFVLDPGFVQTDLGNEGARAFGMKQAPTTVDESVGGMYQVLTTATKNKYGGKVVLYTGEVQTW